MNKLKLKILSIFIFTFFSTLFAQESNEIILGKSNYIWNGTQYQIQDTFINTFDKENNITSSLILIWDSVSKSFIYNELSSKNTFIYDKRKNLISELVEKWDSSLKKLTFFYENLYIYDDKNNIISFFKKDQQILSGFKEERFKYVYTYDKYNKLLKKLELKTNFNDKVKEDYNYINYYNYKYFYNDKNKLTHEIHELWDSYNKKFTEDTKIVYTYDSVNNLKSTLTQGYDNNKFINYYIDICEFNDKKLKIEESRKYWDEEKNDFSNGVIVNDDVIGEKFLYSYKNNKLESINQLLWNEKSNSYENHKLTYIYFK